MFTPGDLILDQTYRIDGELGRGAFGVVYGVTHLRLNVVRAVKVLRSADDGVGSTVFGDYRNRFHLEAQLAARLTHPHVIQVYDFQEQAGVLFCVMEYAPGGSLADLLAKQGPLPVERTVQLLLDAAAGLEALHDQLDAVHRDVKPANLLLDRQGRVKVADLGLAQVGGLGLSKRFGSLTPPHPGTPNYASPEHKEGSEPLGPTADVYGLGCVAFELLTGQVWKLAQRKARRPSDLRADTPPWLDAVVMRMLCKEPGLTMDDADDPAKRYVDMTAVHAALRTGAEQARQAAEQADQEVAGATGRTGEMWDGHGDLSAALAANRASAMLPEADALAAAPTRLSRRGLWIAVAGVLVAALAMAMLLRWQAGPSQGATATVDGTASAPVIETAALSTRVALAGDLAATAAPLPGSIDAPPTEVIDLDLAAAVAATLTAQAPTATASATPTPTPDAAATATAYAGLLAAALEATRTALPPTATPALADAPPDATATATQNQTATAAVEATRLAAAVLATLTAAAPTPTHTPTATATVMATHTPNATVTARAAATSMARAIIATLTATAPTLTYTPAATATQTPNATATALAEETSMARAIFATLTAAPSATPAFPATPTLSPIVKALTTVRTASTTSPTPNAVAIGPTTSLQLPSTLTPPPKPALTSLQLKATSELATAIAVLSQTPQATRTPTPVPNTTATAIVELARAQSTAEAYGIDRSHVLVNPVDGAVYVLVQSGQFTMGRTWVEDELLPYGLEIQYDDELPQHTVYLDDFWIKQTEVTNAEYAQCVAARVCTAPRNDRWLNRTFAEYPVVNVDWGQAYTYAKWVGGQLPTEAQWEKACRGIDASVFPWGNNRPDSARLNFANNVGDTQPVGGYLAGASPYLVLDMAGNAWEWTGDWYEWNYYSSSPRNNPTGPRFDADNVSGGDGRALRGGSYRDPASEVRCANRDKKATFDYRDDGFIGFRVVMSPP